MAEHIELRSICTNYARDSDIEEYHEVDESTDPETAFLPKTPSQYNFFTQHDVQSSPKTTPKRPKQRKEKPLNLMDIINSELASAVVPLEKNIISKEDFSTERQKSYLELAPRNSNILQRHYLQTDSESGWDKQTSVELTPEFPNIFGSANQHNKIKVQYVPPIRFDDLIAKINTNDKQTVRFLDIEIKDIKFIHHHQFSLEKLLCIKLAESYNEYNSILKSLKDLNIEIKVNRETKNNLKADFIKVSPDKKDGIRFDPTLRKYTQALWELKEKHIKMEQNRKEMLHNIISLWSDIELIREKIGIKETNYNLIVSKKVLDKEDFDEQWNEVYNTEFSDMLDKIEHEYVNKYIQYNEVKYTTQNLDDSAKKRIKKPKLHIDEVALKEEVEEIVSNIVSREKIIILLKTEGKKRETKKSEKDFMKHKYYFEIYVDDIFVCESEHFFTTNENDFDIEFTESLSIEILSQNTSLTIKLFQNDRTYSDVKFLLDDFKENSANAIFKTYKVEYNDKIEPNYKQVGSGYSIKEIAALNNFRLKSSNMFKGNLYDCCEIKFKLGWSENLSENQIDAIKSCMETGRKIKRLLHGIDKPDTEVLCDLITNLYGLGVKFDESMIDKIRNISKEEVTTKTTFAIDENSTEFVRLKLLHLRNTGGLNIDDKLIPIHGSQITTEQLNCLQSNESDLDVQYFQSKNSGMDPIELQRFIGMKYVQKLNRNMLRNLKEHLLQKTHKDVVRDFKDLTLRSLFTQTNLTTLANVSTSAKQQLLVESLSKEQDIKIMVLRALNLVDRSAAFVEEEYGENIAGVKVRPLRPFVKISYRGVSAQSATGIGCHPTWNQAVKVKTRLEPLSTLHINIYDEYKTNMSDTNSDDDHSHSKIVHYRYQNRWLGTVIVPMHTVLSLGAIRGTFKIKSPPTMFGYESLTHEKETSLLPQVTERMKKHTSFIALNITTSLSHLGGLHGYNQPASKSDDYLIKHLNAFVTEYVNEFPSRSISLTLIDSNGCNKCVTQFLQPIPIPDPASFPKNPKVRNESALSKSSHSKSSSSNSGRREEKSQDERESLYSSMSLAKGEDHMVKLINACVRYVSLIPTYELIESHAVTLIGVELLKVLHGSPLDHTILLASYFLYLGIKCWIGIGLGLPRGQSSYVLIKYNLTTNRIVLQNDKERKTGFLSRNGGYEWYVYDAVSGERSELRDIGCPLKTVDYVFDSENIWVNMQVSQDCESVSFDLTKTSDWHPVFDKTVFTMKQPSALEIGLYSPAIGVERLRLALETRIREKVQRWRSHTKTIWNRYCSSLLRDSLPHWEHSAFNSLDHKPGLSKGLRQLMATYKMFGFPLNLPYISTKSVLAMVKSTAVHVCDDPNVEFGLAVEVYAYPNTVISVWVYLACISRM